MEEAEAKILLASDYDDVVDFVSDTYLYFSFHRLIIILKMQ